MKQNATGNEPKRNDRKQGERDSSERAADVREKAMDVREAHVEAREVIASTREAVVSEREKIARHREEVLRAQAEAQQARLERERVLAQMREMNEKLVQASARAHELAHAAEAARAEMAVSEERFRSLVTTAAAIVFQADAEGRLRIHPESWSAFTGLEVDAEDDESGWGWLRAVHPDERERVRRAWIQAVATRSLFSFQHRLRKRDRSYAWVVARAVPIPRTGVVREWIGMMTDVTDRIRIEEAREQFIAILGHDLRNPVGSISMAAQLLLRTDLPEEQRQTVERIARSAGRIEGMIRDLLDFARGRLGGGIPIKRQPCDLGRICIEQVAEMKQAHPGRAITCEATDNLQGEFDPDRLEQVISNLIGNAIQHGMDPIRVTAREDGDGMIVFVHNEGQPIPAPVISEIFEPFHRRAEERTEGLGLGLYIVSEIVSAHGGTISVTSSEGEGTTFTIRWPRRAGRSLSPTGK